MKDITKDEFKAYESVRTSGTTNMFAIEIVMAKSMLSKKQILFIMKNYSVLLKKYGD